MKKTLYVLLTAALIASLAVCAALADEVPQPEGGKKFEGRWALRGALMDIVYEEEGYRVHLEMYNPDDLTGQVWEYSCHYNGEKDVLESVSSSKYPYSLDPDTFDQIIGEDEYNDFDEENQTTVFAITGEGRMTWADGRENAGADLEFQPIGNFSGIWKNEAEEVYVEISWEGLASSEDFYYTVFICRGVEEHSVDFHMQGLYNRESGKLEASGTAVSYVKNSEGGFDPVEDSETYEAFFSMQENGKLMFETANGIDLDYAGPMLEID